MKKLLVMIWVLGRGSN